MGKSYKNSIYSKNECENLLNKYKNKISFKLKEEIQVLKNKNLYEIFINSFVYFLQEPGKLLRSIILLRSGELEKIPEEISLYFAVAFEMFQVFTLIHDDLPQLDNDDYRRGKKSLHKKFGEANAILAGDALSIYSFKLFTEIINFREKERIFSKRILAGIIKFINIFSEKMGLFLIEGQMKDLEHKNIIKNYNNKTDIENEIFDIYTKKTGIFFGLAFAFGKILKQKRWEKDYLIGLKMGILFQLKDDIDEYHENNKKDELSYLNYFGIDKAKMKYNEIYNEIEKILIKKDNFFYFLFKKIF